MERPRSPFDGLEASKTPESPATDSSLTAAETERALLDVEVFWSSVAVSDMGESGAEDWSDPTLSCPLLLLRNT
jgi:hypothetical protein